MGVIYEDQLFTVKQGWLGPWRVVDKTSGATIAPELILQEKIGLVWPKIRQNKNLTADFRRFAEQVLMQTFAVAAIEPNGPMGKLFSQSSPDAIAFAVINEAQARRG